MIEFLQNFHFLRPWVLLFLLIPLGLYLKKINIKTGVSSWENICDKNLLDFLLTGSSKLKKISVKKFIYTGLVFAILSAAGPAWKKKEVPTFAVENPVIFILSLAPNMQLTDISPSRLERAKFMISDITDNLEQGQFGLEVYSQEPYLITPLSDDVKLIKSLLGQIVPDIVPDQGDRPDRAIDLAIERFKTAGFASGNIVLFASDVGQRLDLALEVVKKAQNLNYTVNVVDASYSGSEKLELLAKKGNGIYLSVKEADPKRLISKISDINQEKMTLSQNLRSNYLDFGYYLLFIPLLCLLPFFRKGILVLCFMMFSMQAEAGFLLNDNQEGLRFFNKGQYEQALNKFQDPLWKGITLYKMDKNDEALKELAQAQNNDIAFYNTGVILTKQCDYEKALTAFNKAVELNPENKDALYNKKVLEDLFERAKSNPSVLECNNNQEQNQQNKNNQQNEQQHNQDNSSSSEQNENSQQPQDNQNKQNQNNDNQSASDNQDKNKQDDGEKNEQSSDDETKNQEEQQGQQKQDKNNDNSSKAEKNKGSDDANDDNQQQKKGDTPDKANNDKGNETQSKNNKGDTDNGNQEQMEEQEASLMNAQKGDDDTPYDEEALAMQRRYREIPEDTGGLLREFIKKEYMKDRYNDENL